MTGQLNYLAANERFNDIRRAAAEHRLANSVREQRVAPQPSGRRSTRLLVLRRGIKTA
jgi:hypothetical protein